MAWPRSESVRIGLYAAMVALPCLLILAQMDDIGFLLPAAPPAAGLAGGVCWWWLGARRPRVGLVRAAAIGLLAGVVFHFILWAGVVPWIMLTTETTGEFEQAVPAWIGEPIVNGVSMWLGFSVLSLLFGGIISVPAGVLGAVGYILWTRRRRGPGAPAAAAGDHPRDAGPAV